MPVRSLASRCGFTLPAFCTFNKSREILEGGRIARTTVDSLVILHFYLRLDYLLECWIP